MYSSKHKEEVIKEAELLIENIYESISGKKINVANEIDWNYDYIFNHLWEPKHYSLYILKDKDILTDVKHVWELSRFYHLVILAQAYVITNDNRYVKKILDDIYTWNKGNPFNYSVNWAVSMEVSIRVVNLIQCLSLIRDSELLCDDTINEINNLIYKHAIYIWNNLEKGLNTNNHYLSNLVGLIWIGVYFKESHSKSLRKSSEKWLKFALKQLDYELGYQIYDDGFSYEDSVSYHCLNLEMLLLTIDILNKNGIKYSNYLYDTVKKMTVALNGLLMGDNIPVIGDMDNGRLMKLDIIANKDKTNFGYLIYIAENILNGDIQWDRKSPIKLSKAGIYRIFNNTFDAIIRCGNIGVNGIGGHSHNDQLSLIVSVNNQLFFTDPGTGYYSGDYELRKELRSTKSHNTLYIENYEQNDISIDLFKMREKTNAKVITIDNNSFEGKHYGYVESLGIIYKRRIELRNDRIEITDELNRLPKQKCYIHFVLDDDVNVERLDNYLVLKKNAEKIVFRVNGGEIFIDNDQLLSKTYGQATKTTKIEILLCREKVKTSIFIAT